MPELDDVLRAGDVDVNETSGWLTRRRPGEWSPKGIIVHHTAGTKSLNIIINGRSDLPGPLSNLHIPKAGPVNLVSAGRCNHAGAGAALVLAEVQRNQAPSGDAVARGLQDGPGGNGYFYGFECENLGDGRDPWPPVQLETIAKACAALCKAHSWSANRVIGHREWTRRKPDPRGFSMSSMRTRVREMMLPTPIPEEEEMSYRYVYDGGVYTTNMVHRQHWESGGPGFQIMERATKDLGTVSQDFHESLVPAS